MGAQRKVLKLYQILPGVKLSVGIANRRILWTCYQNKWIKLGINVEEESCGIKLGMKKKIRDSYRSYWLIDDPISVNIVVVQTALDKPWLTI